MKIHLACFTGYFEDMMIDKIMEGLREDFGYIKFGTSKDKSGNVNIYADGWIEEDDLMRSVGFIRGIGWFWRNLYS